MTLTGPQTVLLATAVVSGITVALAVLLIVAERYLVNYGRCAIDINAGQRRLEVEGGATLLASLMGEGIFIPSACGGKGTCAYCKVKVLEGGGPLGPTEEPLLEPGERGTGVRISCQVKVRRDMRIEIPEALFRVREFKGRVEKIEDLTHDVKLVRIALVEPETIEFTPGQYVQLMAPAYGDVADAVYRAYSIASPPSMSGKVELIIRLVPGGICTTWVFEHLKEGDEVALNGPYGEFRLSEDAGREMIWIAGGSGMAPFWGIVRHMKDAGIARKCRYFFGALTPKDLFLTDELRRMADELDWFQFIPSLSRPDADGGWKGERGLITEVVARCVPDASQSEAYLCGSSGMINASIKVLKEKGLPEDRIYYDKFD